MTTPTPHQKALYYDSLWQKSVSEIEDVVRRKKEGNKCDWTYDVEVKFLNDLKSIKNISSPQKKSPNKTDRRGLLLPQRKRELASAKENYILKEGEFWEIGFKGKNTHLKKCEGLKYIEFLIRYQSRPINPLQMAQMAVEAVKFDKDEGLCVKNGISLEEATDETARDSGMNRLAQINEDMNRARVEGNHNKIKSLVAEMNGIKQYLSETTMKGKIKSQSHEAKKNINTISKAINRVLRKIQKEDIELWRHFNKAIITGQIFSYNPETKTHWKIK